MAAQSLLPPTESNVVVRSSITPGLQFAEYKENLRTDFWFSCAYCTIAEAEAMGIRFTIDHYEPKSKRNDLINEYSNLYWACDLCNQHKSDTFPTEQMRSQGYRFFRADQDEPNDHFELSDVLLISKSNTGEFTINLIGLNREEAIRFRTLRKRWFDSQEMIARGISALRGQSIDQIKAKFRLDFLRDRRILETETTKLVENLRELNRSALIDPDAGQKEHAKNRRKYLKGIHNLCAID
jgi:hypothetical protein